MIFLFIVSPLVWVSSSKAGSSHFVLLFNDELQFIDSWHFQFSLPYGNRERIAFITNLEWKHMIYPNSDAPVIALQLLETNEETGCIFIVAYNPEKKRLEQKMDVLDLGIKINSLFFYIL